MIRNTSAVLVLSGLLALSACKQGAPEPAGEPEVVEATPEPEPEPVVTNAEPEPEPEPPKEWNTQLTHSVRLLAGLELPEDSELYSLTQTAAYKGMKADVDRAWTTYEEKDRKNIEAWRAETLAEIPALPVFYPFSGPDMLNAVTFLPQGTEYMMFGLEPVGTIPQLADVNEAQVMDGARKTNAALVNILGMNFFHTKIMAVNIGSHPYNGIAGVICWFLARTGHDVLDARYVMLAADGSVVELPESPPTDAVSGVEIMFRATGETSDDAVKAVRYFPGDISDDGWTQRPGLEAFVMGKGEVVTFLKASSYLMFRNSFDDVRSAILARSVAVIEGASGIPYHYFADAGEWDARIHGVYTAPIPLFEVRCQPDLAKASAAGSKGELPFSYDYTHWKSHLLYAVRPEGRALETPKYDASGSVGESTYCANGQLVVDGR